MLEIIIPEGDQAEVVPGCSAAWGDPQCAQEKCFGPVGVIQIEKYVRELESAVQMGRLKEQQAAHIVRCRLEVPGLFPVQPKLQIYPAIQRRKNGTAPQHPVFTGGRHPVHQPPGNAGNSRLKQRCPAKTPCRILKASRLPRHVTEITPDPCVIRDQPGSLVEQCYCFPRPARFGPDRAKQCKCLGILRVAFGNPAANARSTHPEPRPVLAFSIFKRVQRIIRHRQISY